MDRETTEYTAAQLVRWFRSLERDARKEPPGGTARLDAEWVRRRPELLALLERLALGEDRP